MAKKTKKTSSEPKKLYRSKQDKLIAGVCGGIAEYSNIDPVWVRLGFVILCLINGIGLILYIVAWILIPENPSQKLSKKTVAEKTVEDVTKGKGNNKGAILCGVVLFIIGALLLLKNVINIHIGHFVWPILLITLGIYLIIKRKKK